MNFIFFGESKNEPGYPHYHVGAVSINEEYLVQTESRVAELAFRAFGTRELSRETELHAIDIYHRKRNFKDWPDVEKRIQLLRELKAVLSLDSVHLIKIQINCNEFYSSQDPATVAFIYFCERANAFAKQMGDVGMLIGDRENDRESERFAKALSGYRSRGTDFEYGQDIHNLVDSVHFTHSHLSRLLQLADVYTWLLQFSHRNRESKKSRHRTVLDLLREDGADLGPRKYKTWPPEPVEPIDLPR